MRTLRLACPVLRVNDPAADLAANRPASEQNRAQHRTAGSASLRTFRQRTLPRIACRDTTAPPDQARPFRFPGNRASSPAIPSRPKRAIRRAAHQRKRRCGACQNLIKHANFDPVHPGSWAPTPRPALLTRRVRSSSIERLSGMSFEAQRASPPLLRRDSGAANSVMYSGKAHREVGARNSRRRWSPARTRPSNPQLCDAVKPRSHKRCREF